MFGCIVEVARAVSLSGLQLQIPDWVDIVKTATFKELPPQDKDWYYIRAGATQFHYRGTESAGRTCQR
jgi:ribosomal protein S19E (S16A)